MRDASVRVATVRVGLFVLALAGAAPGCGGGSPQRPGSAGSGGAGTVTGGRGGGTAGSTAGGHGGSATGGSGGFASGGGGGSLTGGFLDIAVDAAGSIFLSGLSCIITTTGQQPRIYTPCVAMLDANRGFSWASGGGVGSRLDIIDIAAGSDGTVAWIGASTNAELSVGKYSASGQSLWRKDAGLELQARSLMRPGLPFRPWSWMAAETSTWRLTRSLRRLSPAPWS